MDNSVNNLDGSFQLPGPLSGATSEYSSEEDSDNADYTNELSNEGAKHCYDDWLFTKRRHSNDGNDDISQLQRKIWSAQESSSKGSKSFARC